MTRRSERVGEARRADPVSAVASVLPTPEGILADHASSTWIRSALTSALQRDPVDALNDAIVLAAVLEIELRRKFNLKENTQRHVRELHETSCPRSFVSLPFQYRTRRRSWQAHF